VLEASGRLADDLAHPLLAHPSLLAKVARYLLDSNFPPTLQADITAAVGLDLDMATDGEVVKLAVRHRDPSFRAGVLLAYEGRCAMSGWEGSLAGDAVGVEAAHIRWFTINGPDSRDNGVCLCSLHHKLLVTEAIGITAEMTVAVSLAFKGHGPVARNLVYDLLGQPLEQLQAGQPTAAPEHIAWHTAQVFRAPGRKIA
jgi:putative restriction endonuclease